MTQRLVHRKTPTAPVGTRAKGPPGLHGHKPYRGLVGGIAELLDAARRASARAVNAIMAATYWEIGRRIVEYEQQGAKRAEYGVSLLTKLSADLTDRYGRGFGVDNLQRFRLFYLAYPPEGISATSSRESLPGGDAGKYATPSRISSTAGETPAAPSESASGPIGGNAIL